MLRGSAYNLNVSQAVLHPKLGIRVDWPRWLHALVEVTQVALRVVKKT